MLEAPLLNVTREPGPVLEFCLPGPPIAMY